jgi:hypothetical protein
MRRRRWRAGGRRDSRDTTPPCVELGLAPWEANHSRSQRIEAMSATSEILRPRRLAADQDAPTLRASQDDVGSTPLPSQPVSTSDVDKLADELADRLRGQLAGEVANQVAARLEGLSPGRREPLIDAQEVARRTGRTREWVYDHQGELGAIRLGSGPKPRLGFDPARVLAHMERVDDPTPVTMPPVAQPSRRQRQRADRTAAGAELLRVRGHES